MATVTKFISMISATGRMPASAAPTAAPTMASSAIGVVLTRLSPYLVDSPLVTLKTPPPSLSPISSPSRNTRGIGRHRLIQRDVVRLGEGNVLGSLDGNAHAKTPGA